VLRKGGMSGYDFWYAKTTKRKLAKKQSRLFTRNGTNPQAVREEVTFIRNARGNDNIGGG